ncbi:DsrE family protein [Nitrosovibrio sp. Nv4]|uniref:DsrE family protein n=1 Tax=Nitrosovibrio sp. Nv4 TaxID=1945880 RepID=UPI000BD62A91|nr:DsrE family protein [Nitrosovibrio sp. Nv4]SOD39959.1 Intracellular sulfur oxidation protein, DsrE/DsrF family [Nitrosovibrio sp. Nv4]
MKLNCRLISCCFLLGLAFDIPVTSAESAWQNPVIQGFGKVQSMPEAAVQPSPDREYKILFDVTKAAKAPEQVNPGLEHIARLINIFALAKVPPEKLKIVAVLHGPATAASLDNRYYREKYQFDNPNLELIEVLKRNGVIVYVCGQALAHSGFASSWVNREVTVALAALTVLPVYQLDGYALIPE